MKKIVLLIIIILIAQFLLASKTVVYGDSVSVLEKETLTLKRANQKLELKIASQISCSAIARKAAEAGFVSMVDITQPKVDFSVALRR